MSELVYPVYDDYGKLYRVYIRHHAAKERVRRYPSMTYKICKLMEVE